MDANKSKARKYARARGFPKVNSGTASAKGIIDKNYTPSKPAASVRRHAQNVNAKKRAKANRFRKPTAMKTGANTAMGAIKGRTGMNIVTANDKTGAVKQQKVSPRNPATRVSNRVSASGTAHNAKDYGTAARRAALKIGPRAAGLGLRAAGPVAATAATAYTAAKALGADKLGKKIGKKLHKVINK